MVAICANAAGIKGRAMTPDANMHSTYDMHALRRWQMRMLRRAWRGSSSRPMWTGTAATAATRTEPSGLSATSVGGRRLRPSVALYSCLLQLLAATPPSGDGSVPFSLQHEMECQCTPSPSCAGLAMKYIFDPPTISSGTCAPLFPFPPEQCPHTYGFEPSSVPHFQLLYAAS